MPIMNKLRNSKRQRKGKKLKQSGVKRQNRKFKK
jgi:hypothetical protein